MTYPTMQDELDEKVKKEEEEFKRESEAGDPHSAQYHLGRLEMIEEVKEWLEKPQ